MGVVKLMHKIEERPELNEKLTPIIQDLQSKIIDLANIPDVEFEIYAVGEAIAYACEKLYGKLPKNPHTAAFYKNRMTACENLISLFGIDGARTFVKKKLRKMYADGELGPSLHQEVEDYKKGIATFFEQNSRMQEGS